MTHDDMCEAEYGFYKARCMIYKYGIVLMQSYFESDGTNNNEDEILFQCKKLEEEMMSILPDLVFEKDIKNYKDDILNFLHKARKTPPMYVPKYIKMAQNCLEELHNFYRGVSSCYYKFLYKNEISS